MDRLEQYYQRVGVLFKKEEKIEADEQELIALGKSITNKIREEGTEQIKFAELLKGQYPALSGLSTQAIVDEMNTIPQIVDDLAPYTSIGALEDALDSAKSVKLQRFSAVSDLVLTLNGFIEGNIIARVDSLLNSTVPVEIAYLSGSGLTGKLQNLKVLQQSLISAQEHFKNDPTPSNFQIANTAISEATTMFNLVVTQIQALPHPLPGSLASLGVALDVLASQRTFWINNMNAFSSLARGYLEQQTLVDTLQERFDHVTSLSAGNVLYSMYGSMSEAEKSLIQDYTN